MPSSGSGAGPSGAGRSRGRRHSSSKTTWSESDSDSEPGLHIGSIRIRPDNERSYGSLHSLQGRNSGDCKEGSDSGADSLEEILQDYAENVMHGEDEDDSEAHDSDANDSRCVNAVMGMLAVMGTQASRGRDPDEGPAPEDVGPVSSDGDDSLMDEDGDEPTQALRAMYPVQVRTRTRVEDVEREMLQAESRERQRRRLLPGQKKQLRKEKVMAKRAARAASKGFNLDIVNQELQAMVANKQDVHGFPPMGKMETGLCQRLASLYGLRSSIQGTGSKRFVLIRSSQGMAIPKGLVAAEVQELLQQHSRLEKVGGSYMHPLVRNNPYSLLPAVTAHASRGGRRARKDRERIVYSRPVAFVKGDVQHDPVALVEVSTPLPPAAMSSPSTSPAQAGPPEPCASVETGYLQEQSEEELSDHRHTSPRATAGLGYAELDAMDEPAPMSENEDGDESPSASPCKLLKSQDHTSPRHRGRSSGHPADTFQADVPWQQGPMSTKSMAKKAQKKIEKERRRSQRRAQQAPGQGQSARHSQHNGSKQPALQYGAFEEHTTGFGSRMLAKMGFTGAGAGLGRQGQGIAEPLQAKMRPRQVGLGHSGSTGSLHRF